MMRQGLPLVPKKTSSSMDFASARIEPIMATKMSFCFDASQVDDCFIMRMKCLQEEHSLKNWWDSDHQPRNIMEMTPKTSPEHMIALLILLVINKSKQFGKCKGTRKVLGQKFASRIANNSNSSEEALCP
jgi:hypothetical protein